ncbi:restriction endonuclease [Acidobacteria bacterium AH-259-A15]|nr:restriction endonuclease [Acidobacteria bacterium AH-259-A15]
MANTVACKQCGTALDEDPSVQPGKRRPCPVCGSTARQFSLHAEAGHYRIEGSAVAFNAVRDTASLLLQAVVVPGAKTDEGQLIEAVTLPWFEIIEELSRNPSLAYQIDYRKWEEIIAGAYQRAGFDEVTLTSRSGDFGRDVIAVKRGLGTVRIIDQVKAYGPNHLVTADDVRALLGVLLGDKASKGFLTTTSDFAPKLRDDILLKPFMPARLELINGKMLLSRLEELAKKKA